MSAHQSSISQKRSFPERVAHAVGFEVMAILISAPVASWLLNKSMFDMGALALMLSTTAMIWNIIYNSLFDKLWPLSKVPRTLRVRIFHALGFEGGFILMGLPIAAAWLGIGLWPAFMLEIGFFLFFLPYTVVYNWVYDLLRQRLLSNTLPQASDRI